MARSSAERCCRGLERRSERGAEGQIVEVAFARGGDQPQRLILELHEDARVSLDPHRVFRMQRAFAGDMDRIILCEAAVVEAQRAMARDAGRIHIRPVEAAAVLQDQRAVVDVNLVALDDQPARQEERRGFGPGLFQRRISTYARRIVTSCA